MVCISLAAFRISYLLVILRNFILILLYVIFLCLWVLSFLYLEVYNFYRVWGAFSHYFFTHMFCLRLSLSFPLRIPGRAHRAIRLSYSLLMVCSLSPLVLLCFCFLLVSSYGYVYNSTDLVFCSVQPAFNFMHCIFHLRYYTCAWIIMIWVFSSTFRISTWHIHLKFWVLVGFILPSHLLVKSSEFFIPRFCLFVSPSSCLYCRKYASSLFAYFHAQPCLYTMLVPFSKLKNTSKE